MIYVPIMTPNWNPTGNKIVRATTLKGQSSSISRYFSKFAKVCFCEKSQFSHLRKFIPTVCVYIPTANPLPQSSFTQTQDSLPNIESTLSVQRSLCNIWLTTNQKANIFATKIHTTAEHIIQIMLKTK